MEFDLETKRAQKIQSYQPSRRERKRPIYTGEDWFDEIVSLICQFIGDHMLVVVVDEKVGRLYAGRLEALYNAVPRMRTLTLPGGEQTKQLAAYANVVQFLIDNEFHRDDYVLSMGGGTISDLTGFVASTYMRGVQWISVPTTLLAQVDCAQGGKTAVNIGAHKNYCGSFYWPNVILVDTSYLRTLPDHQFRVAVPEIAKAGMIGGEPLFRQFAAAVGGGAGLEGLKQRVAEFVQPSILVKSDVIRRDPYQQNLRSVLQMGHTTGYALESASHLNLHHGEAVGIGLAFESFLAEKRGLLSTAERKALIDIIENCGLQTSLPNELHDRMLVDNMRREKRNRGRTISMILPYKLGRAIDDWPAPRVELTPDEIWSALSSYRLVCA
jgi:3-dehydroquinate synthase